MNLDLLYFVRMTLNYLLTLLPSWSKQHVAVVFWEMRSPYCSLVLEQQRAIGDPGATQPPLKQSSVMTTLLSTVCTFGSSCSRRKDKQAYITQEHADQKASDRVWIIFVLSHGRSQANFCLRLFGHQAAECPNKSHICTGTGATAKVLGETLICWLIWLRDRTNTTIRYKYIY